MTPTDALGQLASPDPIGVSLALFRMRTYRFSDDLRLYVLAEWLEERFVRGQAPAPDTLAHIEASLQQIRRHGTPLPYQQHIAETEGLDVHHELDQRRQHAAARSGATEPEQVVFIVGAPRSGTSHLYNLLAHAGHFAYLTTVSCWAWPTRNLQRPERCPFEALDRCVFDLDNKATRIVPGLAAPHEAEDVYARALPTYQHLGGHRYRLHPATKRRPELLRQSTNAHAAHFNRSIVLTKSPFNSLRIEALDDMWGTKARYLHIVRHQHAVADSMRRNNFRFSQGNQWLTEEDAWTTFNSAVRAQAPPDRLLTVTFEQLQDDPDAGVREITTWLRPNQPSRPQAHRRWRGSSRTA